MGNRLIFLYHLVGARGVTQGAKPAGCWTSRFKGVGGGDRQIRLLANSET